MRIVSICPSNTELLEYLGKTEWLVGVDDYSDWPESVNQHPRVGPDLSIDIDKVAALKPDLVLASLSVPGMERNIEGLKEKGLPFIILNPNTLEEIAEDLVTVGKAIGIEAEARYRKEEFLQTITIYRNKAEELKDRHSLYWEWWPKPIFTPGKANWLTEISELAGGYNIFRTETEANVKTDWDDVLERNPDHICMVWVGVKEEKMNPALVKKRPGWMEMAAIKEGRIHVLEESLYCRPSPRLLEGLKKLAELLHPETKWN
ncbi:cobalamin-binding protein [Thalassobacillus devorans]|uniref:Cobalamin-binding protein n=1 Tax=Thalassobacillus devorans TaxID=279813 RepID=A0ABQ1NDX1_9BACI|nr:cobalamin-binding protein [Thalassobacillus devorans]NIK26933.1 iron complex transport system substrate-binding protein [Thalassobacillus devorans]GGC73554.1 cobalamin-binding protein [Thalassobacillus devorans]